jgi:hypothetical protein
MLEKTKHPFAGRRMHFKPLEGSHLYVVVGVNCEQSRPIQLAEFGRSLTQDQWTTLRWNGRVRHIPIHLYDFAHVVNFFAGHRVSATDRLNLTEPNICEAMRIAKEIAKKLKLSRNQRVDGPTFIKKSIKQLTYLCPEASPRG